MDPILPLKPFDLQGRYVRQAQPVQLASQDCSWQMRTNVLCKAYGMFGT